MLKYQIGGSMKYIYLILLIIFFLSCSTTVTKVDISLDLPELTSGNYFDPAYKEAWRNLRDGEYKLAMENFQKSTIEDDMLFVGYGYVFLYQNKFNFALDNFNKTLEIDPDNILAAMGIGLVFELTENEKRAFDTYSELLIKFPKNEQINEKYRTLKKKKTEEYLSKAEDMENQQNEEEYIKHFKEVLYYSPELIEIKIKIADYYEKNGKNIQAAKYYELLISESPKNTEVLNKLGMLYEKMEKIDEAVLVYKKLSNIEPENITISNKINDLKIKFFDNNLPRKFKDIFFKTELTKEDLAALIGFYFDKYLNSEGVKIKIITDIEKSYARKEIIKICSLDIMKVRPGHRFSRRTILKRSGFAKIITLLLDYLKDSEYLINFKPKDIDEITEPIDISPIHKDYKLIKRLLNSNIMKLDNENRFNQSEDINPADVISSLKKILNNITFEKKPSLYKILE